MVNFDLQRFDDIGQGPKWIWQDINLDGYKGETLYFIPAGKTYLIGGAPHTRDFSRE